MRIPNCGALSADVLNGNEDKPEDLRSQCEPDD